jgi:DNA invertase Pin-like site-specific DNA recombinase
MKFNIFGALSERSLIRDRSCAGLKTAKAKGVKMGLRSKMNEGMRQAVKLLREKGMGIKQIAKQLQIGVGTVYSAI